MSIKDLELAADFCNTLGSPANELNWDNAPECSKRTWDLVGVFSYTLGITMYGHANDEDKPWHHAAFSRWFIFRYSTNSSNYRAYGR